MHNVNIEAVEQIAARVKEDPGVILQGVAFDGDWQTSPGAAQFRGEILLPGGGTIAFEADTHRRWAAPARRPTRSPTASGAAWHAPR